MRCLRDDLAALRLHKRRLLPWVFPNLFAVAAYRVGVALRERGYRIPARLVAMLSSALTGAEIDPQARIGSGFVIEHTHGVVIGPGVVAGERLRLFGGTLLGASFNAADSKHPVHGFPAIGDDVTVLTKASIIGKVDVGDGAVVGAHALVLDDVPPRAKALGVPARCR